MSENVLAELEEKINKYPRFLRNYYFSDKEKREARIKRFYSEIPMNGIVLEGACGKISKIRECNLDNSNIKTLVGVDLLFDSVKQNKDLDFKIVADLENLPFKENYFNVVSLPHVLEHLQNPEKVFKEVNHVLKKRGFLLAITKNIYNPLMAVNKFLPIKFRYWVKKNILKSPGKSLDTFPAPYRCNSSKKIRKVLTNIGFEKVEIWYFGWPLFLTPSLGMFFSMCYEKLTDKKWLHFCKPDFCSKFKKI
jgi:ubiquinone/menaquinone biosynthesis C-methylase UbiE